MGEDLTRSECSLSGSLNVTELVTLRRQSSFASLPRNDELAVTEAFVNKDWVNMCRAMKIYNDVGFDGVFINDHVPITISDTDYGYHGRAFANGYFQALMDVIKRGS